MTKAFGITCLVISVMAVTGSNLTAGPFKRSRATCGPTGCEIAPQNAKSEKVVAGDTSTAQGVALLIVQTGRFRHWGGNPFPAEGIGMGPTPDAALRACCFYGRRTIADVGYARMPNGQWVAVARYR